MNRFEKRYNKNGKEPMSEMDKQRSNLINKPTKKPGSYSYKKPTAAITRDKLSKFEAEYLKFIQSVNETQVEPEQPVVEEAVEPVKPIENTENIATEPVSAVEPTKKKRKNRIIQEENILGLDSLL